MRPKIVTSVAVRVYRNRLGRGICRTFGTTVLSITGCPVRPDNMDNVILSATTMVYSKFRNVSIRQHFFSFYLFALSYRHLFHRSSVYSCANHWRS